MTTRSVCPRCGGQYQNNPSAPGCPACDRGEELFRRNAWGLLQNIAAGLNRLDETKVGCLEVVLFDRDGNELKRGSVAWTLDAIANGLWWDEEGEWASAFIAEVKGI